MRKVIKSWIPRRAMLTAIASVGTLVVAFFGVENAHAATSILGSVDSFDGVNINGWDASSDCDYPAGSAPDGLCLSVRIFYDGPAGVGISNGNFFLGSGFRQDVKNSIGGSGRVNFSINLKKYAPMSKLDGGTHTAYVYAGFEASDQNPGTLIGTKQFSLLNHSPVGYVDHVGADSVSGWTYDPDDSSASNDATATFTSCPRENQASGREVSEVTANQARDDVNSANGITGAHGFTISVPSGIDPGCFTVTVKGTDTDQSANNAVLVNGNSRRVG